MRLFSVPLFFGSLFNASMICCGGDSSTGGLNSGNGSYSCNLTEYDPPYDIYSLKSGSIDVFGRVDTPKPNDIKGRATGGMVGIEARCGSYVRVSGTTGGESGAWWGWVKSSDISWDT